MKIWNHQVHVQLNELVHHFVIHINDDKMSQSGCQTVSKYYSSDMRLKKCHVMMFDRKYGTFMNRMMISGDVTNFKANQIQLFCYYKHQFVLSSA